MSAEDKVTVKFGGKGGIGRYPGPSECEVEVPLTGELPVLPANYHDSTSFDSDYKWVKERGEWVAVGLEEKPIGFDDSEEYASGPFALDGRCIGELRAKYGISPEQLDNATLVRTSPEELEALGKKD